MQQKYNIISMLTKYKIVNNNKIATIHSTQITLIYIHLKFKHIINLFQKISYNIYNFK